MGLNDQALGSNCHRRPLASLAWGRQVDTRSLGLLTHGISFRYAETQRGVAMDGTSEKTGTPPRVVHLKAIQMMFHARSGCRH